jgi:hypothetical protein
MSYSIRFVYPDGRIARTIRVPMDEWIDIVFDDGEVVGSICCQDDRIGVRGNLEFVTDDEPVAA